MQVTIRDANGKKLSIKDKDKIIRAFLNEKTKDIQLNSRVVNLDTEIDANGNYLIVVKTIKGNSKCLV